MSRWGGDGCGFIGGRTGGGVSGGLTVTLRGSSGAFGFGAAEGCAAGSGGAFGISTGGAGACTGAAEAAGAAGSGCGSGWGGGGGGSTIFRMPRIRSPVGVLATRTGPDVAGGAEAAGVDLLLACLRTRSTVPSSSELL
jgi:hypothetical protein